MSGPLLPELKGIPCYREPVTYLNFGDRVLPYEFESWKPESMS